MDKKRKRYVSQGLLIYSIISKSGKTDEEIAFELDVSTRSIAYYKTGERRMDSIKLIKLLQFTETDVQKLEIPL